jgi:hypothetical protein
VSEIFESEMGKLLEILGFMKKFVESNNKNISITEYYIPLGTKTFLEVIEDTFNDPNVNEEQKKEHVKLMKIFVEKSKNVYFNILSSDNPEDLGAKKQIKDSAKILGFAADDGELCSELENVINRLGKEETLL